MNASGSARSGNGTLKFAAQLNLNPKTSVITETFGKEALVSGHSKCTTPGDKPKGGNVPVLPESSPPSWRMYSRCNNNQSSL